MEEVGQKDLGGPGCSHGQSLSHRATAPEELWGTQSQTETSTTFPVLPFIWLELIQARVPLTTEQFLKTVVSDATERQAVT